MTADTAIRFVYFSITDTCTVLALNKYSGYIPLLRKFMKAKNGRSRAWNKPKMFLPLNVFHLNSLEVVDYYHMHLSSLKKSTFISIIAFDLHNNSAGNRKGVFCTFPYQFISLRYSVATLSHKQIHAFEHVSHVYPWDTSKEDKLGDKVLDSG